MVLQAILYQITSTVFGVLAFISLSNPTKVNVAANRWFGIFFMAAALMLLNGALTENHLERQYQQLIGYSELTRFMMAPALYLAIVHLTTPGSKLTTKNYLHFIPLVMFWIYLGPRLLFPGLLIPLPHALDWWLHFFFVLVAKLQPLVYWLLSIYKLKRHQKNIRLIVSDVTPVDLRWLKHLLLTIGGMIILFTVFKFVRLDTSPVWAAVLFLIGSLFTLHYLIAQREVYAYEPEVIAEINEVINEAEDQTQSDKTRMSQEQLSELKLRLERLMNEDKLYLNGELSLPQLAAEMAITTHDLSWLLNHEYQLSFFHYINAYRISEAKQLLLSEQHKHLNMLGIAYSSGFNAKTTFNTAFKKETGLSPTQFIMNAQNERTSPSL